MASIYAMLSEFPNVKRIANAHLRHIKIVQSDTLKDRYWALVEYSTIDVAQFEYVNSISVFFHAKMKTIALNIYIPYLLNFCDLQYLLSMIKYLTTFQDKTIYLRYGK